MGRMIYTKIVIDMKTGKTLEREGRWYDGEIAECKGGGSSVNNVDYGYNDRMATIAEEQQAWAKDYYKMWETHFKPYETAQAQTNLQNLPLENSVYRGQLEAARDLLPLESGLYKQQLKAEAELLPQQTEATKNFLSASAQGVDVAERMGLAKADVSSAWKNVSDATATRAWVSIPIPGGMPVRRRPWPRNRRLRRHRPLPVPASERSRRTMTAS